VVTSPAPEKEVSSFRASFDGVDSFLKGMHYKCLGSDFKEIADEKPDGVFRFPLPSSKFIYCTNRGSAPRKALQRHE
jgi:hypothetical protein